VSLDGTTAVECCCGLRGLNEAGFIANPVQLCIIRWVEWLSRKGTEPTELSLGIQTGAA
jgi:hypothetical protein